MLYRLTRNTLAVAGGIALVLAFLVALAAGPALAHVDLVSSSPKDGAVLERSPRRVVLRFSGDADPARSRIVILQKAGKQVGEPSAPKTLAADATVIFVTLTRRLPPGTYTVDWRGAPVDGFVSSGSFQFRVDATATPASGTGATAIPSSSSSPSSAQAAVSTTGDKSGADPTVFLAGTVVLLLVVGAGMIVFAVRSSIRP